jgi:hypothetical protein
MAPPGCLLLLVLLQLLLSLPVNCTANQGAAGGTACSGGTAQMLLLLLLGSVSMQLDS